jgi:hypothetical protein
MIDWPTNSRIGVEERASILAEFAASSRLAAHQIAAWRDVFDVCAPYGLSDLFGLIVRPNTNLVNRDIYEAKAERWRQLGPLLTVLAWPG